MPLIQHKIHVYERPKAGSDFIKSYPIYNYQHTICNQGWFDTASGDIGVYSDNEGQQIIEQYLGCFVAIYVDNPAVPIWEGLINRITFNSGGASYTISLDDMVNRSSVVYTGAANAAAQTAVADNLISQAIYGIKQEQIEFGVDTSAGNARTNLRDTILTQRAYPQTSITQAQGNTNIVHFELIGIYHTLEWVKQFTGLTAATFGASATVASYVSSNPNLDTFFLASDASKITTNLATVPLQKRAQSYWEVVKNIAETGDASNYWVCGVLPTDPNTGSRLFYYKVANSTVLYTASKRDGLIPRNLYGKRLQPWLVVPDNVIRVTDALVALDDAALNNPSVTYIQSIQYDANSQRVQWFGADDTTARGAFKINRGYKPFGVNFGAPTRTIAT